MCMGVIVKKLGMICVFFDEGVYVLVIVLYLDNC